MLCFGVFGRNGVVGASVELARAARVSVPCAEGRSGENLASIAGHSPTTSPAPLVAGCGVGVPRQVGRMRRFVREPVSGTGTETGEHWTIFQPSETERPAVVRAALERPTSQRRVGSRWRHLSARLDPAGCT
jgi:hypothetical protein